MTMTVTVTVTAATRRGQQSSGGGSDARFGAEFFEKNGQKKHFSKCGNKTFCIFLSVSKTETPLTWMVCQCHAHRQSGHS
jgi:hypothetical protein